jgi:alpha-L-arabinofuranosidase
VITERFTAAWDFYKKHEGEKYFVYAVDEHYYMRPEWFYAHADFYDNYPRTRKVFSGEYAAHPADGNANNLEGALAEAAFLTGVERNADVVLLSSYAPLFARHGFQQWWPDLIWFDEETAYGSPSFYVQKMYSNNMGTEVLDPMGLEKDARERGIYYNASYDAISGEVIVKIVNMSGEAQPLVFEMDGRSLETVKVELLGGNDLKAVNSLEEPENIKMVVADKADVLENQTFAVYRLR